MSDPKAAGKKRRREESDKKFVPVGAGSVVELDGIDDDDTELVLIQLPIAIDAKKLDGAVLPESMLAVGGVSSVASGPINLRLRSEPGGTVAGQQIHVIIPGTEGAGDDVSARVLQRRPTRVVAVEVAITSAQPRPAAASTSSSAPKAAAAADAVQLGKRRSVPQLKKEQLVYKYNPIGSAGAHAKPTAAASKKR